MRLSRQNSIEIRPIVSLDDMDRCVDLQRSVWKFDDLDLVPRRMFVVAKAIGGQILGAWDGETLSGYLLAIPGIRDGLPYLHSHMLAVLPQYRNLGIGMQLKLVQRQEALARGIKLIEWTFDPLQSKNAYFNIEKLGAVVRRYTPDFYGLTGSPLHNSLPTDRLHAEWWLQSKRVQGLIAGNGLPEYTIKETVSVTYTRSSSSDTLLTPPDLTLQSLLLVRHQLTTAFSRDLIGLRFQFADSGDNCYLLGTASENDWM